MYIHSPEIFPKIFNYSPGPEPTGPNSVKLVDKSVMEISEHSLPPPSITPDYSRPVKLVSKAVICIKEHSPSKQSFAVQNQAP
jgi:hypothetical protein